MACHPIALWLLMTMMATWLAPSHGGMILFPANQGCAAILQIQRYGRCHTFNQWMQLPFGLPLSWLYHIYENKFCLTTAPPTVP